ncbi:MAG: TRAP transporter substrate-binding protein DctP [Natronospirillum sp.]|uniref:TRAP transporter substrate-binding protein DctP n=1 Tax=Natronospirillum sp. TaxID=2812955 RepID=UPI0025EC371F|nr:TRAP transporter substrate-binding protein DctP [Natronospirillum sp.]MCH8550725.1 TRAP transporter substrate-binding protein DctP [Natronospirillum sp.]
MTCSVRRILAFSGLLCAIAPGLAAQDHQWTLVSPYWEGVFQTRNLQAFADDVANASDGRIQITVEPGAQRFSQREIPRAVRTGRAEMGEILMGTLVQSDPIYALDNLPFIATDLDAARTLWDTSRPVIDLSLDHRDGMVLLYAVPWPPQSLYTREPVNSLEDLAGVRMRTYSPTTARLAELMGATPVNIETADLEPALAAGTIDAMITSPTTGVSSEIWRYLDHYTDVQAWIPKNIVMMNKRLFLDLDPEDRTLIMEAAATAERRGWQLSEETTREDTQSLADAGMTLHEPGAELTAELEAIGIAMAAEWVSRAGASVEDTLNQYLLQTQENPSRELSGTLAGHLEPGPEGDTLIDQEHGLEWARCSLGQQWNGNACSGRPLRRNLSGTEEAIATLNGQSNGSGDWRLPSIEELGTLVRCTSNSPGNWHIDAGPCQGNFSVPTVQDGFETLVSSWYWSASEVDDNPAEHHGLYFRAGHVFPLGTYGYRHYALPVRSLP